MRKVTQFMQDFNLTDKKFAPMEKALVKLCRDNSELIADIDDHFESPIQPVNQNYLSNMIRANKLLQVIRTKLGGGD